MEITLIERCNKTTEDTIATEAAAYLQTPVSTLKANQEEFIYMESPAYEEKKMDAVVFEFDEMFEVYTALFGLRLQKKYAEAIKGYFKNNLKSMLGSSSASFAGDEGIWEINIALSAMEGFTGEENFEQANTILLNFVEKMLSEIVQ
ncbi:MAG: hypothetical protein KBT36_16420 [Kurthia sp.]|nr:hypothetical protein [Candidatus Kurthia equi]